MKKSSLFFLLLIGSALFLTSCTENYSNGERIGVITKFSRRGILFKTWEGHLNVTQTGMNSAGMFEFSLDRSNLKEENVKLLDSAASLGWKVKLIYHQTYLKNWFSNRGETDFFVNSVEVLDRNFSGQQFNAQGGGAPIQGGGRVVDTIYVVITPDNPDYKKFFK